MLASSTSSVSCGAPASRLPMTRLHLADFLHQVQLRRQAAGGIGEHDVDPRAPSPRSIASNITARRVAAVLLRSRRRRCARPRRRAARAPRPGTCRRRRAARTGPAAGSYFASLPIEVVLPAPLTPASMITNGRAAPTTSGLLERGEEIDERRLRARSSGRPSRRRVSSAPAGPATIVAVAATPTSARQERLFELVQRLVVELAAREDADRARPASFSRDARSPALSRSVQDRWRRRRCRA